MCKFQETVAEWYIFVLIERLSLPVLSSCPPHPLHLSRVPSCRMILTLYLVCYVHRRVWTKEEDDAIRDLVRKLGTRSWSVIAEHIIAGTPHSTDFTTSHKCIMYSSGEHTMSCRAE